MEEEKKIYIGNLEYGVGENELKALLDEKGIAAKEVTVIIDKYTGRSKGFGFAEFETADDAQKAIDALNGQDLNGRALKVNRAQKRKPRSDFGGGSGGGSGAGGGRGRDRRY